MKSVKFEQHHEQVAEVKAEGRRKTRNGPLTVPVNPVSGNKDCRLCAYNFPRVQQDCKRQVQEGRGKPRLGGSVWEKGVSCGENARLRRLRLGEEVGGEVAGEIHRAAVTNTPAVTSAPVNSAPLDE